MDQLPPELLLVVFYQVNSPIILRAVCGTWLDIVDATPSLWQNVDLDTRLAPIAVLHSQAALFLSRSQELPLDISVWADSVDSVLPIISPLLNTTSRWRTFASAGFRTEHIDISQLSVQSGGARPFLLNKLVVHIHDYDFMDLEEGEPGKDSPFAISHPTFTAFGEMELWLTALPALNQLVPMHFTCLTVEEGTSDTTRVPVTALLDLLSACPALRMFQFEGWIRDAGPFNFTHRPPPPRVNLPQLHTLRIKTTIMTRTILSCIIAPRLKRLSLTYLNVARPVEVDMGLGEAGESDDEANDFSESPVSDRATGMAVRNFISRCCPPIRYLDMDYADFRTKDFIWLFDSDRLNQLEEFRIVGSDMSDRVIGLFKPTLGETMRKVRLPKLTRLELLGCQRLTGDAVVASLVPRVVLTDASSEHAKLRVVCISGCEGVTTQHENLLSAALGTRFVS